MKRLALMLARYHAVRSYLAALIGAEQGASRQAQLSHLAERVGTLQAAA